MMLLSRRVLLLAAALSCAGLDFYGELGVLRSASQAEIKAAYHVSARKHHPDKNKDVASHERFRRIATAHETLSDPEKRRKYDMHGDDYAKVERQQEQQRQRQQLFEQQRDFFDPFGQSRRRPRGPPIFSETVWLTSENYADLTEDMGETWLLQFYHDWSEPCKEFAPKWEALAHKLPPMVHLARVNIDQNVGLVQRYRSFLRCKQLAFGLGLECAAPSLVLVTPGEDSGVIGEAYEGQMQAEHIYEWLKRKLPGQTDVAREVFPSTLIILSFLSGSLSRREPSKPSAVRGNPATEITPKLIILSASRSAADTLFARYLGNRFPHLDLGTLHVEGGLEGDSQAAAFASKIGTQELPAVAIWPDGSETELPEVRSVGGSSDTRQRERVIGAVERLAVPSVPLLSAANYHDKCNLDSPGFCILLVVPSWNEPAKRAFAALRTLALSLPAGDVLSFAWVDAGRQQSFAAGLVSQGHVPRGSEAPASHAPTALALRPESLTTGLKSVQTARLEASAKLTQARLRQWVTELRSDAASSRSWSKARQLPPLGSQQPPGLLSRLYAWLIRGGWLVAIGLLGTTVLAGVYWPSVIAWAGKQRHQARPQQRPQQQQQQQQRGGDEPTPSPARPSQSEQPHGARSGSAVRAVTDANLGEVLAGSANVMLFAMNAGIIDGATMRTLMSHFSQRARDDSSPLRQWTLAVLDVSAALGLDDKSPLMRNLLGRLRTSPCAIVRHARKVCTYSGPAIPARVEEWVDRLTMGEVVWELLEMAS